MAVRFLPEPDHTRDSAPERENFAEVIELRARFRLPDTVVAPSASADLESVDTAFAEPDVPTSGGIAVDGCETDGGEADAHDAAVRILAKRARSSGELRRELLQADYAHAAVDAALARCEADLYLDDPGLARALAQKLRDRTGASRAQIRRKLGARLLPDALIETVVAELDEDEETELLHRTAADRARKMGDLARPVAERRLLGYLARRGWSGEPAMRAARAALDASGRSDTSGGVRFR